MNDRSSAALLSDTASQFLQHAKAFLQVLGPAQPEGFLVLHDVGQHGAAQEHHVFAARGVLDANLEPLRGQSATTF